MPNSLAGRTLHVERLGGSNASQQLPRSLTYVLLRRRDQRPFLIALASRVSSSAEADAAQD